MKELYNKIEEMSNTLINDGDSWFQQIARAKNYVCTPNMQDWTFGKSVYFIDGEYLYKGGRAKELLYSEGFENILTSNDEKYKKEVISQFFNWTQKISVFDIKAKFEKDQRNGKNFELLVLKRKNNLNKSAINQNDFDEGFRNSILKETAYIFRDKRAVEKAKQVYGTYCYACGFDFGKFYGNHGKGFIEVHHLYPIKLGERKTTIEDLRPVCANCHRMLHKGDKLLSVEELKQIIDKYK